jgi:hypothetical protein
MTEVPNNVIPLDLYRRDWTVGILYCNVCSEVFPHMWVTGASITYCSICGQLIDIIVNEEV